MGRNMSLCVWILLLITLAAYEAESLYSMAELSVGREGNTAHPVSTGCPMPCDLRSCPVVTMDTCSGRIERDQCQCCPVCNKTYVSSNQSSVQPSGGKLEADDPEACEKIECPRQQMCLLNIQGIAVCRCPSSIYCRNRPRRPVCSAEGKSYRSMCYLKMQACEEDRRIGLKHKGPCEDSKEAEREERLQRKKVKQEKREQRLEKKKQKDERREKKNRKQEKVEVRRQRQEVEKQQRNDRPLKDRDGQQGKRRDKVHGKKVNRGKKDPRKEELRDERRRHRRRLRKIMKHD